MTILLAENRRGAYAGDQVHAAQVAELADALGSGPSVLNGRGGSSPLLGTVEQRT